MFRVLDGLPASGPLPEQFSADGRGTHREGFVVEFHPNSEHSWVGNFQRGVSGLSSAVLCPDGRSLAIIATGQAYVIDPISRQLICSFGGDIDSVLNLPERGVLVFNHNVLLEAWDQNGKRWETRRLSWDGISGLQVEGENLVGVSWDADRDCDVIFSVDLESGRATGGGYEETP